MQVLENRVLLLTFIIAAAIHLSMIAPLSQWLDRSLMPRLADQSLEIDIHEIQSNLSPLNRKPIIPPELLLKKQEELKKKKYQKNDAFKKPVEPLTSKKIKELRLRPQRKIPLSTQIDKDLQVDKTRKEFTATSRQQVTKTKQPLIASGQTKSLVKQESDKSQLKRHIESSGPVLKDKKALEAVSPVETVQSPLFIKKKSSEKPKNKSNEALPDEIKGTFREGKPEETNSDDLQYSMNSYQWTFKRFIDNWVVDIQKWWKAPIDYLTGEMPEGGSLWVQVHLSLAGKLLSYKVIQSNVTSEMELMAIQALIGSLKRPELPRTFYEDRLIINWRFIYPPLRPPLKMRR